MTQRRKRPVREVARRARRKVLTACRPSWAFFGFDAVDRNGTHHRVGIVEVINVR